METDGRWTWFPRSAGVHFYHYIESIKWYTSGMEVREARCRLFCTGCPAAICASVLGGMDAASIDADREARLSLLDCRASRTLKGLSVCLADPCRDRDVAAGSAHLTCCYCSQKQEGTPA